jgi:uncharacterized phiE125 gp8 family phage protein
MSVIVKPVNMAVSLEDARTAARQDGTALDAEIETWVRTFTKSAEHATGRAIIEQTHRVALDRFPEAIRLPVLPVRSVVVKFRDLDGAWQTLDPADYDLDNEDEDTIAYIVPAPGKAWPATQNRVGSVKVDAVCGYGPDHTTTPEEFKSYIIGRLQAQYIGIAAPYLQNLLESKKVFG